MTLTIVLVGWAVLSLVATAGTALMCWSGAQEDAARAQRPLAVPVPRAAADDESDLRSSLQTCVASSGAVTTSDRTSSALPSGTKSLAR